MAKLKILQTVIDLETYGKGPLAAIASIGIVDFYVGDEFKIESSYYANIDQTMNKELNREYDPETIQWWREQNIQVQKALMVDQKPLDVVMNEVLEFIDPKSLIWCQGTDFDIPKIKTTLNQLGLKETWKYNNVRDSRTLSLELGFNMQDFRDPEGHHNALQDSIDQARVINHIKRLIELGMKS